MPLLGLLCFAGALCETRVRPLPRGVPCRSFGACGECSAPWGSPERRSAPTVGADCAHPSGRSRAARRRAPWGRNVRRCLPLSVPPRRSGTLRPCGSVLDLAKGRVPLQALLQEYPAPCSPPPFPPSSPPCGLRAPASLAVPCKVTPTVSRLLLGMGEAGPGAEVPVFCTLCPSWEGRASVLQALPSGYVTIVNVTSFFLSKVSDT